MKGMANMSAAVQKDIRIESDVKAAIAEAVDGTLRARGRGYASGKEAWADIKGNVEMIKKICAELERLHKDMWDAAKKGDETELYAYADAVEKGAAALARECIQTGANARVASLGEDAEVPEEKETEDGN